MDAKDVKRWLQRIKKSDTLIRQLTETRMTLRAGLMSTVTGLSGMPGGKGDPDRLGAAYARIDALDRKIDKGVRDLIAQTDEALHWIQMLPDPEERAVLIARYLRGMMWDRIAIEMHMDKRTAQRLHGRALWHMAEKVPLFVVFPELK